MLLEKFWLKPLLCTLDNHCLNWHMGSMTLVCHSKPSFSIFFILLLPEPEKVRTKSHCLQALEGLAEDRLQQEIEKWWKTRCRYKLHHRVLFYVFTLTVFLCWSFFMSGSFCVDLDNLELFFLVPQSPKFWSIKHTKDDWLVLKFIFPFLILKFLTQSFTETILF